MSPMQSVLMRAFGRPQGALGRMGGLIMARTNADCGTWVAELLEVTAKDRVLEVGFGPGVVLQRLAQLAAAGHVAGIDQSREMVEQARARNAAAVQCGLVELRLGSVESYRLTTTASTRRWPLIPCKSGRIQPPDCEKCIGSCDPGPGSPLALPPIRANQIKGSRKHSLPPASSRPMSWSQTSVSVPWRQRRRLFVSARQPSFLMTYGAVRPQSSSPQRQREARRRSPNSTSMAPCR